MVEICWSPARGAGAASSPRVRSAFNDEGYAVNRYRTFVITVYRNMFPYEPTSCGWNLAASGASRRASRPWYRRRARPSGSPVKQDRLGLQIRKQLSRPPSRPMPDCLNPPNATFMSNRIPLCPTVPDRSRPATSRARAASGVKTAALSNRRSCRWRCRPRARRCRRGSR